MKWTHIYDFLMKVLSIIISAFATLLVADSVDNGLLIFLVVCSVYLFVYFSLLRNVGSWLYCRFSLRMKISLSQAKRLNGALAPVFSIKLTWLPLTEVRDLEDAVKYDAALHIYEQWKNANRKTVSDEKEKFKNSSARTKALTILLLLLCVYFFIAAFLNLPPASYLALLFCKIFSTDSYYPMLNAIILIAITAFAFKAIDKNI